MHRSDRVTAVYNIFNQQHIPVVDFILEIVCDPDLTGGLAGMCHMRKPP